MIKIVLSNLIMVSGFFSSPSWKIFKQTTAQDCKWFLGLMLLGYWDFRLGFLSFGTLGAR